MATLVRSAYVPTSAETGLAERNERADSGRADKDAPPIMPSGPFTGAATTVIVSDTNDRVNSFGKEALVELNRGGIG